MCGLFGVYYKKSTSKKLSPEAIALAIYLTQLRGVHSLGLNYAEESAAGRMMIGSYKESMHDSGQVTLSTTYQTPHEKVTRGVHFDKHIDAKGNRMLAFHTRHATRGQKTRENSHPFRMENVTLMHNGTLQNDYQINNKFFDVDSLAIAYFLDQDGNTPQMLVDKTRGAYALVWTDLRDGGGSVNFLRNRERPLVMAENDDLIIWASTRSVIGALVAEYNIPIAKINELEPYVHVKINLTSGEAEVTKLKEPPKTTASNYYGRGMQDWYDIYGDIDGDVTNTKEAAQKQGNFQQSASQSGNTAGNNVLGNPKNTTNESLDTLIPNTGAWFTRLVALGNAGAMGGSIHNVARNRMLPAVNKRVEYGLETLFKNKQNLNPSYSKGSTLTLSIHNSEILDFDPVRNLVRVTARFPVITERQKVATYDIVVEMSGAVYRQAVYNGMLIGAVVKDSTFHLQDSEWEITAHAAWLSHCFDPSVQGVRMENGELYRVDTVDADLLCGGHGMGNC